MPVFVQLTAFLALIEFKEGKDNGRHSVFNPVNSVSQILDWLTEPLQRKHFNNFHPLKTDGSALELKIILKLERQVNIMEENFEENEDGKVKQWIQDNLRIIISILIVVAIAAGIYSYSKRAEAPLVKDSQQAAENTNDEEISAILEKENSAKPEAVKQKPEGTQISSQETENSFIEFAARGEGRTHLARRALANYLEKNSDSSLSPEHKIYIEDYLRKHAGGKGSLLKGSSVEFSKSLIQDAISKSKNLNQNQLKNLHKYAVRVPSLT